MRAKNESVIPSLPMSPDPRDDPDWLTVKAVSERLSVSTWQVRKWLEAGQFDEIVVFSKKLTRISKGAYNRFVAKNRQASA